MIFDPLGDDDPFDDPFGGDSNGDGSDDLQENLEAVSRETLLAFVAVAVLVQAGLLGGSLGVMLIGFRGQWVGGGVLTIGGVLALAIAYVTYRRYQEGQ